jgi:hypothetical protein
MPLSLLRLLSGLALAACAFALIGCGSDDSSTADSGSDSGSGDDVAVEGASDASVGYPADHTPIPLVDYNGGPILANPEIVTVSFAADENPTLIGRVQQLDDIITTTTWWNAVSSEYCQSDNTCIGVGSSGGHVVLQAPPASSYDDSSTGAPSSLQDFIKANVAAPDGGATDGGSGSDGGAANLLPAPDANTLYVIYFPASVTITLDGETSCSSFGAYHNTTIIPDVNGVPTAVPYAIIPRCGTKESTTTISASHEIIEASTDPEIGIGTLSYYMTNNTLWPIAGGEVGDLCEGFGSNGISWVEATFTLQRSWSNKSAKAGNDPCVPIPPTEVYFNAAPRESKILLPKVGSTAVVDIDAFSDGPYPPWTLTAIDFAAFQNGSSALSFSFDNSSVQNGSYVQLTVSSTATLPGGQDEFVIESTDSSGNRHSWPVLASTH